LELGVVDRSLIDAGTGIIFSQTKASTRLAGGEMDYIDFMIAKGVIIVVCVAIYGFWLGLTGR